uniref:Uncharacterized protein n=1 Tax=Melanopsichium pennsylvanicum 4 TaxID=1398559 RepID=A0A077QXB1_9BASI|nr:uncharacterized protein BN887_06282 [Melanopsichium pennsylvanicum 4]
MSEERYNLQLESGSRMNSSPGRWRKKIDKVRVSASLGHKRAYIQIEPGGSRLFERHLLGQLRRSDGLKALKPILTKPDDSQKRSDGRAADESTWWSKLPTAILPITTVLEASRKSLGLHSRFAGWKAVQPSHGDEGLACGSAQEHVLPSSSKCKEAGRLWE